jgi:histidine triad (HIT) family protein
MARSSSLKNSLLARLLGVARQPRAQRLASLFYPQILHYLPIDRIAENDHWLAFHHPSPEFPLHILIVPQHKIAALSVAQNDTPELYSDLFKLVQQLIHDFQLDEQDYRLITNGGQNQSVPIWHWHLVRVASYQDRAASFQNTESSNKDQNEMRAPHA